MQATDCSFLYFNLEVLDAVLTEACTRPEEARKLPYILAAFSDAHSLLSTSSDSAGASHEVRISPACFCQCLMFSAITRVGIPLSQSWPAMSVNGLFLSQAEADSRHYLPA